MALLTSFMNPNMKPQTRFAESQLTIIDLSDPFIDPASACGLFEIITRLFVRADVGTGKVLVVDEAHKVCTLKVDCLLSLTIWLEQYLSPTKGSSGLTKSLLTLTREQRHLAMRVIISTQGTRRLYLLHVGSSHLIFQNLRSCHPFYLTYVLSQFCTGSPPHRGGNIWQSMYQPTYQQKTPLIVLLNCRCVVELDIWHCDST